VGKHKITNKEDKAQRSKVMAAVKSRGNVSTELKMEKLLRFNRLKGWRKHKNIVGTPDFVWEKNKVALFVDGCFWHKCPYCFRRPKSNLAYWTKKIESNIKRDCKTNKALRLAGWNVIRVWECKINQCGTITRIRKALRRSINI
jgi:DNA mismatch endonuclease (patch repair protein)